MHGKLRPILAIALITFGVAGASAEELAFKQWLVQMEQPSTSGARTGTAEPSVTVLGAWQSQGVLGREVRSTLDENMGRVVDIIVDQSGHVRAAVIDFGGFLGVGSRKIAVDWSALRFQPDRAQRDIITLELTRDQVRAAPEYKDKQPVVVLSAWHGLQSQPADSR